MDFASHALCSAIEIFFFHGKITLYVPRKNSKITWLDSSNIIQSNLDDFDENAIKFDEFGIKIFSKDMMKTHGFLQHFLNHPKMYFLGKCKIDVLSQLNLYIYDV